MNLTKFMHFETEIQSYSYLAISYPDMAKINNMLVSGNMTPQKWVGR